MADSAPDTPVAVAVVEVKAHVPPSLETRQSWIEDWMTNTADGRAMMLRDEQYYYGNQWTAEEVKELNERKQPVITKNLIRRKINALRGEEIEKRVDPVAKPRTPKHEEESHAITDAMRFVEEDQTVDEVGGDAMLDLCAPGQAAIIVECDPEDGYRCLVQHVPWIQVAVDPKARKRVANDDAKWIANIQWMDLDDAIDIYPDAEEALKRGVEQHIGSDDDTTEDRPKKWYDGKRKRVKIVEMYYRSGKDWYRCDFTAGNDLRECEPSAYLDPKTGRPWCPIIVVRCYLDDENLPHGVVRDMISPQDEVNKRTSKALHLLNTNRVIYEEGAVQDINKFLSDLAKPDGAPMANAGALSDPNGARLQINTGVELTQGQVLLLDKAEQSIENIGPSAANIPDLPQSASGRSFAFRQKAASRELGPVFEIFGKLRTLVYWHIWGCIKQFWTDEMWLRVTDEEETAGYRWVGLNRRMTRGERLQELLEKGQSLPVALQNAAGDAAREVLMRVQQMHQAMAQQAIAFGQPPPGGQEHMLGMVMQDPVMKEQIVENQVGEAMMDITIHEAPESAILQDEEFAKLTELMPTLISNPQTASMTPMLMKMLIKLSSFRDKREILKEMDKPADPQQQQMQQAQMQLQMQGAQAGVQVQQTQAQLNAARAKSELAKVQQSGAKVPSEIEKNQASAMRDAAQAGERMGAPVPPGVF